MSATLTRSLSGAFAALLMSAASPAAHAQTIGASNTLAPTTPAAATVTLPSAHPLWSDDVSYARDVAAANGDSTYIVLDKNAAKIYLFNNGSLVLSDNALTGASENDQLPDSTYDKPLNRMTIEDAVTPAGRFTLSADPTGPLGKTLDINEVYGKNWKISIHSPWLGNPSEHRDQRLASNDPTKSHISHGCINIATSTFDKMWALIGHSQATAFYVLPSNRSLTQDYLPMPVASLVKPAQPSMASVASKQPLDFGAMLPVLAQASVMAPKNSVRTSQIASESLPLATEEIKGIASVIHAACMNYDMAKACTATTLNFRDNLYSAYSSRSDAAALGGDTQWVLNRSQQIDPKISYAALSANDQVTFGTTAAPKPADAHAQDKAVPAQQTGDIPAVQGEETRPVQTVEIPASTAAHADKQIPYAQPPLDTRVVAPPVVKTVAPLTPSPIVIPAPLIAPTLLNDNVELTSPKSDASNLQNLISQINIDLPSIVATSPKARRHHTIRVRTSQHRAAPVAAVTQTPVVVSKPVVTVQSKPAQPVAVQTVITSPPVQTVSNSAWIRAANTSDTRHVMNKHVVNSEVRDQWVRSLPTHSGSDVAVSPAQEVSASPSASVFTKRNEMILAGLLAVTAIGFGAYKGRRRIGRGLQKGGSSLASLFGAGYRVTKNGMGHTGRFASSSATSLQDYLRNRQPTVGLNLRSKAQDLLHNKTPFFFAGATGGLLNYFADSASLWAHPVMGAAVIALGSLVAPYIGITKAALFGRNLKSRLLSNTILGGVFGVVGYEIVSLMHSDTIHKVASSLFTYKTAALLAVAGVVVAAKNYDWKAAAASAGGRTSGAGSFVARSAASVYRSVKNKAITTDWLYAAKEITKGLAVSAAVGVAVRSTLGVLVGTSLAGLLCVGATGGAITAGVLEWRKIHKESKSIKSRPGLYNRLVDDAVTSSVENFSKRDPGGRILRAVIKGAVIGAGGAFIGYKTADAISNAISHSMADGWLHSLFAGGHSFFAGLSGDHGFVSAASAQTMPTAMPQASVMHAVAPTIVHPSAPVIDPAQTEKAAAAIAKLKEASFTLLKGHHYHSKAAHRAFDMIKQGVDLANKNGVHNKIVDALTRDYNFLKPKFG